MPSDKRDPKTNQGLFAFRKARTRNKRIWLLSPRPVIPMPRVFVGTHLGCFDVCKCSKKSSNGSSRKRPSNSWQLTNGGSLRLGEQFNNPAPTSCAPQHEQKDSDLPSPTLPPHPGKAANLSFGGNNSPQNHAGHRENKRDLFWGCKGARFPYWGLVSSFGIVKPLVGGYEALTPPSFQPLVPYDPGYHRDLNPLPSQWLAIVGTLAQVHGSASSVH